ncbi:MAG: hypothetical protein EXR76_02790 [Myxococcales bacterium]|nr:hypothetical protein [Myxococcales bacterium]
MTQSRLELLNALLIVLQAQLAQVQSGSQLDPERDTRRAELLDELQAAGEVQPDAAELEAIRTCLERLRDVNTQLVDEVGRQLAQTQEKLTTLDQGRRGVSGYAKSMANQRGPGAKLGRL